MRHLLCLIPVAALMVSPAFSAEVSFKSDIAPILATKCLGCHGGAEAKGGYRVNSFTGLITPGDTESDAITPGDPDGSYLLELIESDDADTRMPKDAEPLPEEQRAMIRRWIEEGARFDGPDAKAALQSYLPQVTHPAPPEAYRFALPVTAVAISPNGEEIAASGYHEITIWSALDGRLLRRIHNVAERTLGLAYSADGAMLAAAGGAPGVAGELRVYNPADGSLVREVGRFADTAFGLAFSPDGTRLAVCGADRAIRVYQISDWTEVATIEDHADWVTAIAFSPDGTKLASASRDKTSKLFDVATGDALATYPNYGEAVYGVAFNADGAQVIVGGRAGRLDFWNAADGNRAAEIGIGGEIQRVLFSEGHVFTAGSDGQARQFKADDRALVRNYGKAAARLECCALLPAQQRLVTGATNGEVRVWNTADGAQLASFIAAPGYIAPDAALPAAAR